MHFKLACLLWLCQKSYLERKLGNEVKTGTWQQATPLAALTLVCSIVISTSACKECKSVGASSSAWRRSLSDCVDLLWKNRIPRVLQIPNSTLPPCGIPLFSAVIGAPSPSAPEWQWSGNAVLFPLCLYRLAQGGHICCMINQHWSCLVGLLVTLMSISWDRISAFSKHFIFWPLASPLAHPCNVPKLHFAVYWRYAECQENLRNIEDTWWSRE